MEGPVTVTSPPPGGVHEAPCARGCRRHQPHAEPSGAPHGPAGAGGAAPHLPRPNQAGLRLVMSRVTT